MHSEVCQHGVVDEVEELAELDCPVLLTCLVHDLAGRQVERGEQIGDSVSFLVVGALFDLTGSHRQRRLGSVECLDAGLLVDTHHDCMFWRVHVQATTSRTLSTNCGSSESLNVSVSHGFELVKCFV